MRNNTKGGDYTNHHRQTFRDTASGKDFKFFQTKHANTRTPTPLLVNNLNLIMGHGVNMLPLICLAMANVGESSTPGPRFGAKY